MTREDFLRYGVAPEQTGIEVAPWCQPLAPKREGWRVLSLDVYPTELLIARARSDPGVSAELAQSIEPVDFVGPAQEIGRLAEERGIVGTVDYIVSSHNFEHLPDPIAFLHGCERVLKPGGQIILVIPDLRGCFDFFKPPSTTAEFIAAHRERRVEPTPETWLQQRILTGRRVVPEGEASSFTLDDDPSTIRPYEELEPAYQEWVREQATGIASYRDTHCWAFTPSSFELILGDLAYLGITTLRAGPTTAPGGNEFHLRLLNDPDAPRPERSAFYDHRAELLHRIRDELAQTARMTWSLRREVAALANQVSDLRAREARRDGERLGRRLISAFRGVN